MKKNPDNQFAVVMRIVFWLLILIAAVIAFFFLLLRLPTSIQRTETAEVAVSTTLSENNISYGLLIYEENFNSVPAGWRFGTFSVDNGELILGKNSGAWPYSAGMPTPQIFTDFIFESQFLFQEEGNRMEFRIRGSYPECNGVDCAIDVVIDGPFNSIIAYRLEHGVRNPLASLEFDYREIELLADELNRIVIVAQGEEYKVFINNYFIFKFNDAKYTSGTFGLYNPGPVAVHIDYIRFYELP